ncbi:CPBP family intramembrane glutamic endopeptidase [Pedobacter heparinus]|uniref:CPBP family intramembrane glutamic endopeptidase n=1 Tax=Pedobacter heparinus TaxID=984 RepID=UPI00292D862C|nr:CPBP family intramembrane glutamic endopeptidase [Pedobacter heparinus]
MTGRFPNSIPQILILLLSSVILSLPIVFIFEFYRPNVSQDLKNTGIFLFWCLSILFVAWIVNKKYKVDVKPNIGINHLPSIILPILTVIFFKLGFETPITSYLKMPAEIKMMSIEITIGALLLAPICEELIFREIILKGLLTRYSPKVSVFLSALLFSLLHFNQSQIIGAIFFGLFGGWIFYKTNSLGLVILLHFLSNLTSITIRLLLVKNFQNYSDVITDPIVIGVIISSVLMLTVCIGLILKEAQALKLIIAKPMK